VRTEAELAGLLNEAGGRIVHILATPHSKRANTGLPLAIVELGSMEKMPFVCQLQQLRDLQTLLALLCLRSWPGACFFLTRGSPASNVPRARYLRPAHQGDNPTYFPYCCRYLLSSQSPSQA
jgi:hypothetical protein